METLANDGNLSEGNPNAPNQNSVPFGLHGGQPPGSGVELGSVRILEWPSSPTELEAACASKKGRSDTRVDTSMEFEESVMDGWDSGAAQLSPEHGKGTTGKTATYADMLAKPGTAGGGAKRTLNFTEDEVVVLEEDCLVDESDPSDERETLWVVGPRLEADGSLSKRFGPWMVAASRRRRYTAPNAVAMGPQTAKGHQSGSRFAALASEDDGTGSEQNLEADRNVGAAEAFSDSRVEVEDITRGKRVIQGNGLKFNKAYMGSNPSRLSKSDKRSSVDPKEVAVVSLVEGVIAEGIVREVSAKKGNHVAVTVLDGTQVPKVLDRAVEGSSKHNVLSNRGLRIKQQLGVRSSHRASNYEVMDDDDPDGGTSAAEMEDQPGMGPGEGVTTMEDEIAPR
ncbi:hypothetical protein V6N13_035144 [Hibiscus sabdariffa]